AGHPSARPGPRPRRRLVLGARRPGRRRGAGRRVGHARGAEHLAGGRLDRLDRRRCIDPPAAEDLARPVLLVEKILDGHALFDRAHGTRSSTRWVSGLRSLIRSAPFSAIMIVTAFVFARVIVGITDASTTRSPSMP